MANLCLDAADGKHEPSRTVAPVCAQCKGTSHVKSTDNFARCAQLDLIAQTNAYQRVMHQPQTLAKRCADVIDKFYRCRTRATLRPIYHDKIWQNIGFQHGFSDGKPLPWVANTKLKPYGLAAG